MVTDILIVVVGGILSGITVLVSSFLGLLIKTFGIDFVIFCFKNINVKTGKES